MYDVRLRLYNSDGTPGRVLKTLTFTVTPVESGTPQLTFSTSRRVAGFLESPFLVAVQYSTGGAWVQPRNGLFIVEQDANDNTDTTQAYSFTATGFVPWLMQKAQLALTGGAKNGQRTWTNASAGQIILAMVTEAKSRGWGPLVTTDFTAAVDSNGSAWPTADKVTEAYSLLTPMSQALDGLSSQGLCEWWTEGTLLRLFKTGTGTDKTAVRLGGRGFTRSPMQTDFSSVFTHLTVVPEKAKSWVQLDNPGADTQFGRLEASQTQSGVKDAATATRLAQPALTDGKLKKRQLSYEWTINDKMPRPWADFNIGDQVTAVSRSGKEQLRAIGFVVTKAEDGSITARAVLGSKLQTLIARIVKRTGAASMGGAIGGTGSTFPASGATAPDPAAPGGLHVVSNTGYFAADGTAKARVELAWNAVDTASDGSAIDVERYEVWARIDPAAGSVATASSDTDLMLDGWESGVTRKVKVRALSVAGVWGDFSAEVDVTPAFPVAVLDPPTAPSGTSKLSTITVTWDGSLVSGPPPAGFDHVVAKASAVAGGPYQQVGGSFSTGGQTFPARDVGASVGDTVYVVLYAVNTLGVSSPASAETAVVVTGIEGPDIEVNTIRGNNLEFGAVDSQYIAVGARTPGGSPVQRVPAPLTDVDFWGPICAGTRALTSVDVTQNAAATPGGIVLTPTPTQFAQVWLTEMLPVPKSGKVSIWMRDTATNKRLYVRWFDAALALVGQNQFSTGRTFPAPATATQYAVFYYQAAGAASTTIQACEVFEVIGDGDLQSAELTPQGLTLFDATGTPAVQLSTSSDNLITINQQSANGDTVPVAQIDSDGNGAFQSLDMSGEITFPSADLVGAFGDITYNGQSIDTPFLERYPRGVIYSAGLGVDDGTRLIITGSAQYQGLAIGTVTLDPGRLYTIGFDNVFMRRWTGAAATGSLVVEVWIGTGAQNVGSPNSTGGVLLRWPVLESDFTTNAGLSTPLANSRPLQLSGTFNILVRLVNPPSRAYQFYNIDVEPRLVIEDMGPAIDASDGGSIKTRATSGAVSLPGTANPQPKTQIFNAAWSALWDSGGNKLGSGASLYADGRMVQGGNSGSRAGQVGFPALGLSGRTATGMWIRLRNRHAGAATIGVDLGTHGNSASPSGSAPNLANAFTRNVKRGSDTWIPIPSSLWAGFLAGTYRGIQIGGPNVNSGASDYGIFDGFSTTNAVTSSGVRPQLKVSYK